MPTTGEQLLKTGAIILLGVVCCVLSGRVTVDLRVNLGAAFALLLYFYISAAVLLFGAEVNAEIHRYTSGKDATDNTQQNDGARLQ